MGKLTIDETSKLIQSTFGVEADRLKDFVDFVGDQTHLTVSSTLHTHDFVQVRFTDSRGSILEVSKRWSQVVCRTIYASVPFKVHEAVIRQQKAVVEQSRQRAVRLEQRYVRRPLRGGAAGLRG